MNIKIIIGGSLVIIASIIFLILLFKKNNTFFNLRKVVKKHFEVFSSSKINYIIFYMIPIFFAIGISLIYIANNEFYSVINVILSIILSMLFAMMSILSGYDFRNVKNEEQKKNAEEVVAETINAIVFDSMLCVFLLLFGLVALVANEVDLSWIKIDLTFIKYIISAIVYYVFVVILLNLLLIIKHLSNIIDFKKNVKYKDDK